MRDTHPKHLPLGQAYQCPKCGRPMRVLNGPYDGWWCIKPLCFGGADLWYDKPKILEVSAVTQEQISRFEKALRSRPMEPPPDIHPDIWKAQDDAMSSQIESLWDDLAASAKLKDGE